MRKLFLSILILLSLAMVSNAQDIYNFPVQTDTSFSYDNYDVGYTYVRYGGVFSWQDVGDSTYNIHTKPFLIGNANINDGFITTNVVKNYGAASDFIVRYHFSNDLETWTVISDGDLDQDADQVDVDTLGVVSGVNDAYFHGSKWMVLEFDGQTANIENQVVTWGVTLKLPNPVLANGQPVNGLAGVANKSKANP